MKMPRRSSVLWFTGILLACSIALGYDYIFLYDPPIRAVRNFETAMGWGDIAAVKSLIVMSSNMDLENLHEATDEDVQLLLTEPFNVGRILDMRKRGDDKRKYYYVVYRNADAQVYAFIITEFEGKPRIVVSDRRGVPPSRYLWEYTWNY